MKGFPQYFFYEIDIVIFKIKIVCNVVALERQDIRTEAICGKIAWHITEVLLPTASRLSLQWNHF